MTNTPRPVAFMIASTDHGTMIVNRFDQHVVAPNRGYGLGYQILNNAAYDPGEVALLLQLLDLRRKHHGNGLVAVDCGANLGVHTIEWAKRMTGWGVVVAFEAQERIYYALAGNITINNCFNARAINAAVSSQSGSMKIPNPNYLAYSSFGSLELKKRDNTEFIGQAIDYAEDKMVEVRTVHLDSFNFPRLDFLKIDVEGMELDVLAGGAKSIGKSFPIIVAEALKTDTNMLRAWLENAGYKVFPVGLNFIAIHQDDKCLADVRFDPPAPSPKAAAAG